MPFCKYRFTMLARGAEIRWNECLITRFEILSLAGGLPRGEHAQMLSTSQESVGCSVIGGWLTSPTKELNEEFTSRIAQARLGPILIKYLQNSSAIFTGSVIVLPSDANDEGKGDILLRLFITSLRWLDTVFQGQYLPSLSIKYVAKNKILEKLPPQLY